MTTLIAPVAAFADGEAEFDPFAGDYVPGEIPANLITSPAANSFWYNSRSYQQSDTKNDVSTGVELYTKAVVSSSTYYGGAGFIINTDNLAPNEYKLGEHYVFAFATRNLNLEIPAQLHIGIWRGTYSHTKSDFMNVLEYEDGLVDITNDGEWNEIKVTLPAIPELTSSKTSYAPSIRFGFVNGTPSGARIGLNSNHSGILKPYIAKETIYDISIAPKDSDTASLLTGDELKFEAKILNQIGSIGSLADKQNFTYTVFGSDGNAVEGLTVENEGGVAVVSAIDSLAEGTYYIRATSAIDETTTWQKTLAFEVLGVLPDTNDHVRPEKNANVLESSNPVDGQTTTAVNYTGENLPDDVTADRGSQYYVTFKSAAEYTCNDYWGVGGSFIRDKSTAKGFVPEANTTYVFKAPIRSRSGKQRFNLTYSADWNGAKTLYSNEYGAEGKLISTDWEDFKATISVGSLGSTVSRILIGLKYTTSDDYLVMNTSGGIYFAEEQPYDISVSGVSSVIPAKSAMNLEAEIVNQIELPGNLEQSFDWVAVTTDRRSYVDGITFTPSNDGANVIVNVAETVIPDDYIIVAQDKNYGMNRQYPITVTPVQYDVTELSVSATASSASLDALTVNTTKNAQVVFAAFNGKTLVSARKAVLTPVEGVATLDEAIAITGLSAGNEVRVFVWDEALTPFSMSAANKTPTVIAAQ